MHHNNCTGVVLPADDNGARLPIQKAVASAILPETTVKIKEVIVDGNTTEEQLCNSLLNSGPTPSIVIDTTNKETIEGEVVKHFVRHYGIPSVTTSTGLYDKERSWIELGNLEKEWLLQINNPTDIISSLVDDIITEYGVSNAVLFYDSSFQSVKKKLDQVTKDEAFRFRSIFMSKDYIRETLAATKGHNVSNFIILGGMATINRFLETAGDLELLDSQASFYFITKSRGQVKCPSCRSASILLLQPTTSTSLEYNHTANLININGENKLELFFYYDLTRFLIHTIHQMKVTNNWPELSFPSCGGERKGELSIGQINERKDLILGTELAADGFYGKFGRFVFDDFSHSVSYQDIAMRVTKVDFLRGQIYDTKLAEWMFGEHHGRFVYGSYQNAASSGSRAVAETTSKQSHMRIVIYLQPPFIMKSK